MAEPLYRVCTKCKRRFPESVAFFYARKRYRAGLSTICRKCEAETSRKWRANNREKSNGYVYKWIENNPDRQKEFYRICNERRSKGAAALRGRISSAIYWHLRNAGTSKGKTKWEPVLGWDISDLIRHLERQFCDGMTWENYGKWHVDHIRPVSSFKFTSMNDPEFRACWALSNLRPLWARENIQKRDNITLLI